MTKEIAEMLYQDFVKALLKPGEVMDQEVSAKEEELLDKCYEICSQAEKLSICAFVHAPSSVMPRPKVLEFKHMSAGLIGEAAELLDAVKKIVIYRKATGVLLDNKSISWNVREELGDLAFFITGYNLVVEETNWGDQDDLFLEYLNDFVELWNEIYPEIPMSIESAIDFNKEKLWERYAKKTGELSFSNQKAQDREDKVEKPKTCGIHLILQERKRQIEVKGFTLEGDDRYIDQQLLQAGWAYENNDVTLWPITWTKDWFKLSTPIRNLVKAGALYHAEKGRLERAGLDNDAKEMQQNIDRVAAKIDELNKAESN